jgi:hypothetical protein
MTISIIKGKTNNIAKIESDSVSLHDVQSAIDLIADVLYGHRIDRIILNEGHFTKEFYDLNTGLLGGIIQKFSNYAVKVAIVGDFDLYMSNSFADFIYETNKGKTLFFVSNIDEAINKLSNLV